jgi:hypothetical protein
VVEAAGCLGVVVVEGRWVVVVVFPSCSEASPVPGSACPCSFVCLQLLCWKALGKQKGGRPSSGARTEAVPRTKTPHHVEGYLQRGKTGSGPLLGMMGLLPRPALITER